MQWTDLFTRWKGLLGGHRPALSRYAGSAGFPLVGGGGAPFVPQGYEAQLRELYLGNAIAQRAVRLVCDAVAEAPILASGTGAEQARALLAAPSGGQLLMETLAAHLLLHGNAYVQCVEDGAGALAALYALRPERVRVEPGSDGWPVAYSYQTGGAAVRLTAECPAGLPQIIAIRLSHPADDHYGLGALAGAAGAIAVHNAAARWNKALLDNAARPSGALTFDGGDMGRTLTAEQFETLKGEIERAYMGAMNAGRPLLLEGNLKWQALSLSPAEMDFAALKESAAREIACAFGVPPMLLGLPGDATYANYREAHRALWKQTAIPLANRILTAIDAGLAGWLGEAPGLAVDLNRVDALAEDREKLWARVTAADFLTAEEKKALVGMAAD